MARTDEKVIAVIGATGAASRRAPSSLALARVHVRLKAPRENK
jgi:hypothetical protein